MGENVGGERGADLRAYSPLTFAFVGDAVYELAVRTRIAREANRPANELNRRKVRYVNACAQAKIYDALIGKDAKDALASGSAGESKERLVLTEEEADILRRGRNANPSHTAKGASVSEYRRATAVETLLGFLYLHGRMERTMEIIEYGIRQIDA